MPPRIPKPKPLTVEVDAAQLAVALHLIASNTAPYTVTPVAARGVLDLERDLIRAGFHGDDFDAGSFDIGWGLRASDQS
jgi:hypothetical protein